MFSAAEAAKFVDDAHRARARYQNLPEAIAPRTVAEAYEAQEALGALWVKRLGPVAGLKIATTTKVMQQLMGIDHPCGGMIFASRIHKSPAVIAKADFVNVRVECELAVRLGRDLPKSGAPYTRATVRDAIASIMPAFELIEDRNADYKTSRALSLIADNAWNGGIVIGPEVPLPPTLDLNGISGTVKRNGTAEATGKTDDPLGALAWLANLAVERGRPMTAGMVVITGSLIVTIDIAPGERLDFSIDGVGTVTMTGR
ncbi:MAG TPA: fumarylacetoacetate hydrolase family protein [Hyphomicrobiaceae bacterium]|jgi:2-keto-4-pentenoate hydratase|nr:fumarylacetoacetate hydrolase family protein [Hyphomicrobiaceae bacterium]